MPTAPKAKRLTDVRILLLFCIILTGFLLILLADCGLCSACESVMLNQLNSLIVQDRFVKRVAPNLCHFSLLTTQTTLGKYFCHSATLNLEEATSGMVT